MPYFHATTQQYRLWTIQSIDAEKKKATVFLEVKAENQAGKETQS